MYIMRAVLWKLLYDAISDVIQISQSLNFSIFLEISNTQTYYLEVWALENKNPSPNLTQLYPKAKKTNSNWFSTPLLQAILKLQYFVT